MGLLVPGAGQIIHRDVFSAVFVFLGATVPLLFCSFLSVRLINLQVQPRLKEAPVSLLDGEWTAKLSEIPAVPPELVSLALLGLAIHIYGAWSAASGPRATLATNPK